MKRVIGPRRMGLDVCFVSKHGLVMSRRNFKDVLWMCDYQKKIFLWLSKKKFFWGRIWTLPLRVVVQLWCVEHLFTLLTIWPTTYNLVVRMFGYICDSFVYLPNLQRGWASWLTAATDQRVEAVAPLVIPINNLQQVRNSSNFSIQCCTGRRHTFFLLLHWSWVYANTPGDSA